MKQVQTVFLVDGQTYAGEGSGQTASGFALETFSKDVVKLHGFIIDGEFKPADLTSHWDRSKTLKGLALN